MIFFFFYNKNGLKQKFLKKVCRYLHERMYGSLQNFVICRWVQIFHIGYCFIIYSHYFFVKQLLYLSKLFNVVLTQLYLSKAMSGATLRLNLLDLNQPIRLERLKFNLI